MEANKKMAEAALSEMIQQLANSQVQQDQNLNSMYEQQRVTNEPLMTAQQELASTMQQKKELEMSIEKGKEMLPIMGNLFTQNQSISADSAGAAE